jgi:hypothetical protein
MNRTDVIGYEVRMILALTNLELPSSFKDVVKSKSTIRRERRRNVMCMTIIQMDC